MLDLGSKKRAKCAGDVGVARRAKGDEVVDANEVAPRRAWNSVSKVLSQIN